MTHRSAPSRAPRRPARLSSARRLLLAAAMAIGALGAGAASTQALAQGMQPPGDLMRPQGSQKPSQATAPTPQPKPQDRAFKPAAPSPGAQAQRQLPVGPAIAAVDGRAQRATVDRLTAYYNSVQSLTGTFTQIDPDGSRRTGDVYMQKPGRVRFEYDPPSPVELISNGQSVAVRDRRLNTQDLTPLSQTPLRFLLAERVDLGNDPHVEGIYQDERVITVVMQEKVPMMGTYRLLIMFDAKDYALKSWIVTDPQGYDTQVTLNKAQVNKKPDPRLFVINTERMLE